MKNRDTFHHFVSISLLSIITSLEKDNKKYRNIIIIKTLKIKTQEITRMTTLIKEIEIGCK